MNIEEVVWRCTKRGQSMLIYVEIGKCLPCYIAHVFTIIFPWSRWTRARSFCSGWSASGLPRKLSLPFRCLLLSITKVSNHPDQRSRLDLQLPATMPQSLPQMIHSPVENICNHLRDKKASFVCLPLTHPQALISEPWVKSPDIASPPPISIPQALAHAPVRAHHRFAGPTWFWKSSYGFGIPSIYWQSKPC